MIELNTNSKSCFQKLSFRTYFKVCLMNNKMMRQAIYEEKYYLSYNFEIEK
jgi:hypothetical protein